MEVTRQLAKERPAVVGEDRRQARRRIERLGDLEELGWVQPAAADRPPDRRADVAGRPDPGPRPLLEEVTGLVRLVEPAGHDHRVARWLQRFGQPPRWPERRGRGEPGPDGRELEQAE